MFAGKTTVINMSFAKIGFGLALKFVDGDEKHSSLLLKCLDYTVKSFYRI